MEHVEGRVAVVTGGASGIGRGMANAFVAAGMKLVLADIDAARLDQVGAELRAVGVEVVTVPTDVADPDAVEALAVAAVDAFGAVHVLCNNAGVFTIAPQWETSLADWSWVVGVNFMGVVHGVRSFVPRMIAQGDGGHVVNTASMAGLITAPLTGSYCATKHAVVGLSKTLRAELRISHVPIGVSVVCPGEVATDIVRHLRDRYDEDEAAPVAQATFDRLQDRLDAAGMDPDDAGRMVLDAIRADRFWVLPAAEPHLERYRTEVASVFEGG